MTSYSSSSRAVRSVRSLARAGGGGEFGEQCAKNGWGEVGMLCYTLPPSSSACGAGRERERRIPVYYCNPPTFQLRREFANRRRITAANFLTGYAAKRILRLFKKNFNIHENILYGEWGRLSNPSPPRPRRRTPSSSPPFFSRIPPPPPSAPPPPPPPPLPQSNTASGSTQVNNNNNPASPRRRRRLLSSPGHQVIWRI